MGDPSDYVLRVTNMESDPGLSSIVGSFSTLAAAEAAAAGLRALPDHLQVVVLRPGDTRPAADESEGV